MTNNISVNVVEKLDRNDCLLDLENIENLIYQENNTENYEDDFTVLQLDYSLNYSIKQLKQIAYYYKIKVTKLNKDSLIENIILFETLPENQTIVYKRKRLWYFVDELKNDVFFKNVLFPI